MECEALSAQRIYGIAFLVIIHAHDLLTWRNTGKIFAFSPENLPVSLSVPPIYYSKMSSESAASNSSLFLNAPTRLEMIPTGAVSWVGDYFCICDPKYDRKSHAVCSLRFLKNTKYADGKKIDRDCANWKVSYGQAKERANLITTCPSIIRRNTKKCKTRNGII